MRKKIYPLTCCLFIIITSFTTSQEWNSKEKNPLIGEWERTTHHQDTKEYSNGIAIETVEVLDEKNIKFILIEKLTKNEDMAECMNERIHTGTYSIDNNDIITVNIVSDFQCITTNNDTVHLEQKEIFNQFDLHFNRNEDVLTMGKGTLHRKGN